MNTYNHCPKRPPPHLDPALLLQHDALGGLYDGEDEGEQQEERQLRLDDRDHLVLVVGRVRHALGVHFQGRGGPASPLTKNGLTH